MTCLICGGDTRHYTTLDATKSGNNQAVPLSGKMVDYVQCDDCQFIFCPELCDWPKEKFLSDIYNDDYIKVDPDYTEKRSQIIAQHFIQRVRPVGTMLDYGAGNKTFEKILRLFQYDIESWDTMWGTPAPNKQYDLVTSFEVFEHMPQPKESLEEILQFVKPTGRIMFTTLMNDTIPPNEKDTFWYLAPRNGHVCMHSYRSLDKLFAQFGMACRHIDYSWHEATFI